jgi:diguanylate cyclase (GGDEF)-like protein
VGARGRPPGLADPETYQPSVGARQALSTGRPISCGATDPRTRSVPTRPDAEPPSAWLWLPIRQDAGTIAVLELGWPDLAAIEDPSRMALTRLLAVEAAVTLQRMELLTELHTIARTDELTGLPNRRAWQEYLPRELARGERAGQNLTVAMLDLDHFKRFNDAHGHLSGDRLLKQVAAAWMAELRPSDMLSRYGGEEFALVLPACPGDEALEVVERLRTVMPGDQTCSAGMAIWDGIELAADLVERADRALYDAKRAGRQRTAVAGGAAPAAPAL